MMPGDAREVAAAVAAEVGIDEVLSHVPPEDKARHVGEYRGCCHQFTTAEADGALTKN